MGGWDEVLIEVGFGFRRLDVVWGIIVGCRWWWGSLSVVGLPSLFRLAFFPLFGSSRPLHASIHPWHVLVHTQPYTHAPVDRSVPGTHFWSVLAVWCVAVCQTSGRSLTMTCRRVRCRVGLCWWLFGRVIALSWDGGLTVCRKGCSRGRSIDGCVTGR